MTAGSMGSSLSIENNTDKIWFVEVKPNAVGMWILTGVGIYLAIGATIVSAGLAAPVAAAALGLEVGAAAAALTAASTALVTAVGVADGVGATAIAIALGAEAVVQHALAADGKTKIEKGLHILVVVLERDPTAILHYT